jgi:hypothetical protein
LYWFRFIIRVSVGVDIKGVDTKRAGVGDIPLRSWSGNSVIESSDVIEVLTTITLSLSNTSFIISYVTF